MKLTLKTSFLLFLLLASLTSVDAATITWLGGNAAWDDASQWDNGTIPSYGDDVIIPSGYAKIYGGDSQGATSVEIQSGARLYIYNGGHLEIQGAVDNDGLHNMGRVYLYGGLAINDITQTNTAYSAKAINNEQYIFTYSTSVINIKYIDDIAIENAAANSYFRNRGGLYIFSVNNTAIKNYDRFFNYGTIDISNSGSSNGFLITNTDYFKNVSGGVINLNSNIYGGISNAITAANFRNYGDINIDNVTIGINNHGTITNHPGATIDAQNNSASFFNRQGATIYNHDKIKSSNSGSGIYNYGDLYNYDSFWVFSSTANGGVMNFSTGFIDNYHDLYLSGTSYKDIYNQGHIVNQHGSIMEINKSIDMSAGSSITNYGFVASHGAISHTINGSFGNKGAIDDNQGLLQGLISNYRLLIAPLSSPMQVGVPYENVLDVASLDGLDIEDWKISQTGAVAGTYDEVNNVFTPNASAVGITTIYIAVRDLASGYSRNFSLEIGSPILPFTKKGKIASSRNAQDDENANFIAVDVNVFPNPSNGTIQLESDAFEMKTTQVQIFNAMGQMVQQERFNAGSISQSLEFSSQLTNGLYIVKLIQNGNEMNVKRVQLYR